MTEEQKQALIEWLKPQIDELQNVSDETPFGLDSDSAMHLNTMRVALAALTAPPVKFPPRRSMLTREDIDQDYVTCMAISVEDAIAAIRAAGYEVQE